MLRVFLTITSVFGACAALAQEAPTGALNAKRLDDVALRWAVPEELPEALGRELDQTFRDLDAKRIDAALPHWVEFLRRRELRDTLFDPGVYVDYLLHRIVATRDDAANTASRHLRFYDAQETAVFEHMSTVDKQISIYGGEDKPQVALREPQLADYADGIEAVTLAPAETVGIKELIASLHRWRDRAPAISEARETALEEFVRAVQADAPLNEELTAIDANLRAKIKTVVVREVTPAIKEPAHSPEP